MVTVTQIEAELLKAGRAGERITVTEARRRAEGLPPIPGEFIPAERTTEGQPFVSEVERRLLSGEATTVSQAETQAKAAGITEPRVTMVVQPPPSPTQPTPAEQAVGASLIPGLRELPPEAAKEALQKKAIPVPPKEQLFTPDIVPVATGREEGTIIGVPRQQLQEFEMEAARIEEAKRREKEIFPVATAIREKIQEIPEEARVAVFSGAVAGRREESLLQKQFRRGAEEILPSAISFGELALPQREETGRITFGFQRVGVGLAKDIQKEKLSTSEAISGLATGQRMAIESQAQSFQVAPVETATALIGTAALLGFRAPKISVSGGRGLKISKGFGRDFPADIAEVGRGAPEVTIKIGESKPDISQLKIAEIKSKQFIPEEFVPSEVIRGKVISAPPVEKAFVADIAKTIQSGDIIRTAGTEFRVPVGRADVEVILFGAKAKIIGEPKIISEAGGKAVIRTRFQTGGLAISQEGFGAGKGIVEQTSIGRIPEPGFRIQKAPAVDIGSVGTGGGGIFPEMPSGQSVLATSIFPPIQERRQAPIQPGQFIISPPQIQELELSAFQPQAQRRAQFQIQAQRQAQQQITGLASGDFQLFSQKQLQSLGQAELQAQQQAQIQTQLLGQLQFQPQLQITTITPSIATAQLPRGRGFPLLPLFPPSKKEERRKKRRLARGFALELLGSGGFISPRFENIFGTRGEALRIGAAAARKSPSIFGFRVGEIGLEPTARQRKQLPVFEIGRGIAKAFREIGDDIFVEKRPAPFRRRKR